MKVILRSDVENLGSLGDLVEVRPGYGRNFLLPQGLAMLATSANLKVFELERKKLQAKVDALRSEAASLADRIKGAKIVISMRVGENDKLYGSVTSAHIAEALAGQGIEIDRRRVLLDASIRTLGEHQVRIRLHADVVAELNVVVAAERTRQEEEQAEAARPEQAREMSSDESAAIEEAAAE